MDTSGIVRPYGGEILRIDALSHSLGDRSLFSGLGLVVRAGESVAVMGPSGSGKSTLLACVLGLTRADHGTVRMAGEDMARLRGKALARHRRRHIGMVFQFGELLPELTPVDNVAFPALLCGTPRAEAYRSAQDLLRDLGVPTDGTTERLSGGERQRTAVARALVNRPTLLLADEPTGSLDAAASRQVADLLMSLPPQRSCGLLLVTHDAALAGRADRVLHLHDGQLVEQPPSWTAAVPEGHSLGGVS